LSKRYSSLSYSNTHAIERADKQWLKNKKQSF
jgi:hypothetical protein